MSIFQGLNRTQGITIVMVTHSDEVASHADRIIGFRDGLIVSDTEVIHSKSGSEPQAAPLTLAATL
jgi:putative ABC transport system ATP-binding protein